jgi:hypothetical protein
MALREEYQQTEMVFPDGTSPAMQDVLRKVIQKKRASSFHTTMVAMKLACDEKKVVAHSLKCGDSAFFAFSHEGELLSSSLTNSPDNSQGTQNKRYHSSLFEGMSFGPGDQILVRVEGLLSNNDALSRQTQIQKKHHKKWLVCAPIEVCGRDKPLTDKTPMALRKLCLRPVDRLLVPRYLHGTKLTSKGQRYRILDYSSTIRFLSTEGTNVSRSRISQRGTTTKVLPDHFYGGYVESYQDRFPPETHFVLCSDGLYSCFSDATYMWRWLRDHIRALSHKDERQSVLRRLHSMLNAKSGDDDISFIWVYPRKADILEPSGMKRRSRQD